MSRDDRPDPTRPTSLNPRDLRKSLSSSMGLGRSRPGEAPRAGRRAEPLFEPEPEETGPAVEAGIAAAESWFEPSPPSEPAAPAAPAADPPAPAPTASGGKKKGTARRPTAKKRQASAGDEVGGRDIVPPQAIAGRALLLVVAIMGFLACLAVGGLALVREAARDWQLDVSREVTIQVKPLDGQVMEPRLQKALDIARATTGVRAARLVDEREGAALLEPWLGRGLDLSALPVPRLVVIELADPASADLEGLKRRVAADLRGASVDDHAVWAVRLRTMASTMVVAGLVVVALMLTAMVLSVVFATRAAMAGNRDVIEVLHFVGAEDRFIAAEFQRHFLKLGFVGGAAGGLAAIFVFLVADFATRSRGDAVSDQAHALFGGFSVGWTGHLGALAVVGLVAVLTALTSRFTVLGHLGRLD